MSKCHVTHLGNSCRGKGWECQSVMLHTLGTVVGAKGGNIKVSHYAPWEQLRGKGWERQSVTLHTLGAVVGAKGGNIKVSANG